MPYKRADGMRPVGPHFSKSFLNVFPISLFLIHSNPYLSPTVMPVYSSIEHVKPF
jgi:hypothetical protein